MQISMAGVKGLPSNVPSNFFGPVGRDMYIAIQLEIWQIIHATITKTQSMISS